MTAWCTVLASTVVLTPIGAVPAGAGPTDVSVRTLYFDVSVGPDEDERCVVVGDLYVPTGVTAESRAPAVLTTNGFGGSKNDLVNSARMYAEGGYVVLAYSGLGFGGSSCKITLDHPEFDGRAARALVSYLGGSEGIAFADPGFTRPETPLDRVILDEPGDPRVGMTGASYGGAVQFAAASVDPRIDTIVPMITWNDLSHSMAPNGAEQTTGVDSSVPGAAKLLWTAGFFTQGVISPGAAGYQSDPARADGCPNFEPWVCPAFTNAIAQGIPDEESVRRFREVSVTSYVSRIRIPVLLIQGEQDTLFDLGEASATFDALRGQGTPVSMIWQRWGHGSLAHTPGDYDAKRPDARTQYVPMRIMAWLDHHLRGAPVDSGPAFSYFRPWVAYDGIAGPAYATSDTFPVGMPTPLHLSGDSELIPQPQSVVAGQQSFSTGAGGLPTGLAPPSMMHVGGLPPLQRPGSEAQWTTEPFAAPFDVVGSPVLRVRLGASTPPVVFAKIYDVRPDGTATTVEGLVTPARVLTTDSVVEITLSAIVHRFEPGHRLRVALSGADNNFRGGLTPARVTVTTGDPGQMLTVPVVP
ncbi:CocE/NonD family hydrolase [Rhodococcus tibetensis]|uniref:ABC transporter ATP-binding protein n=1 Tax=Rhodococcus tibetensis TaxID=2965064 RepID=A0ABT1QGK3_9NOCA|nr:CocE/NonD family hydrolase [Rhodococcus sp. FXJ9.536]MCQ4121370.1 ABC transporter ATP-binding protein [Rhodococcus sp. FXJ9.536]